MLVYDVVLHQNLRSQSLQCQQLAHLNRLLASEAIHNDLLQRLFVLRRFLEGNVSATHEHEKTEAMVHAISQVEQLYLLSSQIANQLSDVDKDAESLRS